MGNIGVLRTATLVCLVLAVVMAAPPAARAAATQESRDLMHEVQGGDCLHLIAGYYYGDARMWERIWHANRHLVRDPNVLVSGSLLLVPNATVPPEPYPDFTARAIGCGPAGARSAAAKRSATAPAAMPSQPKVR